MQLEDIKKEAMQLKSELAEVHAILEAIQDALDGKEPSDFMLSFPVVRQVQDLYNMRTKQEI